MRRKCNCYIALTRFWTRTFQNTGRCIKGMHTYPPNVGTYVPSVISSRKYVSSPVINFQWLKSASESPSPLKNVFILISEVCISVIFSAYVLTTKYRGKLKWILNWKNIRRCQRWMPSLQSTTCLAFCLLENLILLQHVFDSSFKIFWSSCE